MAENETQTPEQQPGYAERDAGETSPQTGGGEAPQGGEHFGEAPLGGEEIASDAPDSDAGGRPHTELGEGHPAGEGPRSDRDVGGPTSA